LVVETETFLWLDPWIRLLSIEESYPVRLDFEIKQQSRRAPVRLDFKERRAVWREDSL
jgi:hypothetical protein